MKWLSIKLNFWSFSSFFKDFQGSFADFSKNKKIVRYKNKKFIFINNSMSQSTITCSKVTIETRCGICSKLPIKTRRSWNVRQKCGFKSTIFKFTSYEFNFTSYEFKSTSYEFRSTIYEFSSTCYGFNSLLKQQSVNSFTNIISPKLLRHLGNLWGNSYVQFLVIISCFPFPLLHGCDFSRKLSE